MLQYLQILQLTCFILSIGTLIALGLIILFRRVVIIHRRWYLLVVYPLLLANPLAILENNFTQPQFLWGDWQFWIVIIADLAFFVFAILLFRGYQIIGLDASEVMSVIKTALNDKNAEVDLLIGERQLLWTTYPNALVLTSKQPDCVMELWAVERQSEVLLRLHSAQGREQIRKIIPLLRAVEKPYDFKVHAVGVLYIVLAVVMAVLGWIFFFEPRLILVD